MTCNSLDSLRKSRCSRRTWSWFARALVLFTFGNASGIDRERGLVVIKPSGVDYAALDPLRHGGDRFGRQSRPGPSPPSSDLATHLLLYKEFPCNRRGGAHPLGICYRLGPGGAGDSRLRHDPCGLLLRPRSRNRRADGRGNRRGVRAQHRALPSAAVFRVSIHSRSPQFW